MQTLNLMLGGMQPSVLPTDYPWCGVDRGALHLIQQGIAPLFSFGDFDSVNAKEKQLIEQHSQQLFLKTNQNQIDLEFALDILSQFPKIQELNIYGATGGRLDHLLGNFALLHNEKYQRLTLNLIDDCNKVHLQRAGTATFSPEPDYRYFSIFPIQDNSLLSIQGAKYCAENLLLTTDCPNATSNEFVAQNKITIQVNKPVMVIYSRDVR